MNSIQFKHYLLDLTNSIKFRIFACNVTLWKIANRSSTRYDGWRNLSPKNLMGLILHRHIAT
jgi:hypothetical protein